MSIEQDVLKSELPPYIKLFEIDLSPTKIPELTNVVLRLTPSGNYINKVISFGGYEFTPYPIEITNIELTSDGAPARPTLNIATIDHFVESLAFIYNDIIGAEVTFTETFEPYLNKPTRISMRVYKFLISQKLANPPGVISFELVMPMDNEYSYLPAEQMLKKDFPGLATNRKR